MTITFDIPIRAVSTANRREHWAAKHRRNKEHRGIARVLTQQNCRLSHVRTVKLTRLGPRRMDGDNNTISLKAARDGIADALGIDDGDERITWLYDQEKAKEYGVRVEVSDLALTPASGGKE